jgi:hypothetical protein
VKKMATFISIAQAMPQAAVRPPDGRIGDSGENPQAEMFLSALRTALTDEEGGGKKARGAKENAESGAESPDQKKKDEILCTVFLGQMLNMPPNRNDDALPVSGNGNAAGVIPAVGAGAEGTVLAGAAERSGNGMQALPNLPAAGAPEPAASNAQETAPPQAFLQEEISGRETDPVLVPVDARTAVGEESFERRFAPQISQESDTVSGKEAPAADPASPNRAVSGVKAGEIQAERKTLSAEWLSVFD